MMTGKRILVTISIVVGVGLIVGLVFGWEYSIVGLGAGLGPWIGAYFGNKKAREVDAYREEWLSRRAGRSSGKRSDGGGSVADET